MNRRGFFASAFGFVAGVVLGECTKEKKPEVKWDTKGPWRPLSLGTDKYHINGLRPRYWTVPIPTEPGTFDIYADDNRVWFVKWDEKTRRTGTER